MAQKRDFYEVLGVSRGATADEIRSAYRKLARKFHPDVNKDPEAAARFAEVTEAYDVLADVEKRKQYDRYGHVAGAGAGAGGAGAAGGWRGGYGAPGGPGGPQTYTWTSAGGGPEMDVDLGDLFEQMFGGAGVRTPFGRGTRAGGGPGPSARPFTGAPGAGAAPGAGPVSAARRGSDVHHNITIAFMTAALGGKEALRYEDGGVEETIEVKIPQGIESGAKLRIKGKGHAGQLGSERGDLILTVKVGSHPCFRREGLDILLDVPLTIAEAVLGTKVRVPLLKGSADLTIPPGTSSGQRLRIRGKGISDTKGRQGDFHAVAQIAAPAADSLSEKAREDLREIAKELKNTRTGEPWE